MAKENQVYKISGAKLKKMWLHCMKYAEDFTIQHSGITKDFCMVTTKECVDYQKKENNLLVHFDGRWICSEDYADGLSVGKSWKQILPTKVIWQ